VTQRERKDRKEVLLLGRVEVFLEVMRPLHLATRAGPDRAPALPGLLARTACRTAQAPFEPAFAKSPLRQKGQGQPGQLDLFRQASFSRLKERKGAEGA